MSEHAPHSHEHQEALPTAEHHEALPAHAERHEQHHDRVEKRHEMVAEAQAELERAMPAELQPNPVQQEELKAEAATATPAYRLTRSDIKQTRKREQLHIQKQETPIERVLSKTIHQPVVRVISEAASKTVSRPSGFLGAGILAFVGSTGYLYLSKHLGFRYNYLVFLMLFAAGFALGLVLELVVHLSTASRRQTTD